MISHLATLIEEFPGSANQTRCFTHILNLVVKSVLCQFEGPKAKGGKALVDAAKELTNIFDQIDYDDVAHESEGNECDDEGNEDVGDDVEDDDDDGLADE